MFEAIVAAIDGSGYDRKTLDAANELSGLANATVRVVHVRQSDVSEEREDAKALVDRAVAGLVAGGVAATGTVRPSPDGQVAQEILNEAAKCGASVIVMGCRGLGDLTGLLIGSTAHEVLRLGRLPVLLVR